MWSGILRLPKVRGGVHPQPHKDRSAALHILDATIPERLFLPLRQHAGSPAMPVVRPGEYVLKGQLIAVAPTEISAPIHAPTSGRILDIAPVKAPHTSGLEAEAIILECDGEDRWIEPEIDGDPYEASAMELADRVARAGIVGLGGAIFPASVKLKQGARHEIKTVLINGSECEPFLTCDDRLMREKAEEIIEGGRLIRHILRAYRVVVAIEDNKPEAIAAMRAAAEPHGMVEVQVVPSLYPMGSAKQLIQEITGREVPAGGRSTSVGVLVHNVGTVYAIHQALTKGRPLVSRIITVAGSCVERPRNVEALIGTPVQHLFDRCGGFVEEPAKLILGGPMMGTPLPSTDVPTIKGATGVLALSKKEIPRSEAAPCIRCARCVDACPMGLLPLEMAKRSRVDDFEGASEFGLSDCILCGSCAYVCPSHIPLVQYFQYAKGKEKLKRDAAWKMEYTVALSNAKTERIEAEKAAKAAEKAAKKAAAQAKKEAAAKKAAEKKQQQAEQSKVNEEESV